MSDEEYQTPRERMGTAGKWLAFGAMCAVGAMFGNEAYEVAQTLGASVGTATSAGIIAGVGTVQALARMPNLIKKHTEKQMEEKTAGEHIRSELIGFGTAVVGVIVGDRLASLANIPPGITALVTGTLGYVVGHVTDNQFFGNKKEGEGPSR